MKHISKKTWFAFSLAIVAISAVFALKKPVKNEKSSHIVVDRLVNQLVCKFTASTGGSRNYPRGFMRFSFADLAHIKHEKKQRNGGDKYTFRSSQKVVAQRQGRQRGDRDRPVGGDF